MESRSSRDISTCKSDGTGNTNHNNNKENSVFSILKKSKRRDELDVVVKSSSLSVTLLSTERLHLPIIMGSNSKSDRWKEVLVELEEHAHSLVFLNQLGEEPTVTTEEVNNAATTATHTLTKTATATATTLSSSLPPVSTPTRVIPAQAQAQAPPSTPPPLSRQPKQKPPPPFVILYFLWRPDVVSVQDFCTGLIKNLHRLEGWVDVTKAEQAAMASSSTAAVAAAATSTTTTTTTAQETQQYTRVHSTPSTATSEEEEELEQGIRKEELEECKIPNEVQVARTRTHVYLVVDVLVEVPPAEPAQTTKTITSTSIPSSSTSSSSSSSSSSRTLTKSLSSSSLSTLAAVSPTMWAAEQQAKTLAKRVATTAQLRQWCDGLTCCVSSSSTCSSLPCSLPSCSSSSSSSSLPSSLQQQHPLGAATAVTHVTPGLELVLQAMRVGIAQRTPPPRGLAPQSNHQQQQQSFPSPRQKRIYKSEKCWIGLVAEDPSELQFTMTLPSSSSSQQQQQQQIPAPFSKTVTMEGTSLASTTTTTVNGTRSTPNGSSTATTKSLSRTTTATTSARNNTAVKASSVARNGDIEKPQQQQQQEQQQQQQTPIVLSVVAEWNGRGNLMAFAQRAHAAWRQSKGWPPEPRPVLLRRKIPRLSRLKSLQLQQQLRSRRYNFPQVIPLRDEQYSRNRNNNLSRSTSSPILLSLLSPLTSILGYFGGDNILNTNADDDSSYYFSPAMLQLLQDQLALDLCVVFLLMGYMAFHFAAECQWLAWCLFLLLSPPQGHEELVQHLREWS